MRKVHWLRPGRYGLFENLVTNCGQVVKYFRDCYTRSVYTGARYDYTNESSKVTCLVCQKKVLDKT